MDRGEAYEAGRSALRRAWGTAANSADLDVPDDVRLLVAEVMQPTSMVGQLYGLPTQVLLKVVLGCPDSRVLKDFPQVTGAFSARTFAKYTVVQEHEVSYRLGYSDDPYVSNPMRKPRLDDEMIGGQGGENWRRMFEVLAYLDEHPEVAKDLLALILRKILPWPVREPEAKVPTVAVAAAAEEHDLDSLIEVTSQPDDLLLDLIEVLESDQPQVVLAGPPGTGKTHTALAVASYLVGDRHTVVQFHSSYGYEEFVEGLRPRPTAGGGFEFAIEPGAVRVASEDLGEGDKSILILDEFNRANLPRVLGELLFALERRGQRVNLMYTKGFALSPGLGFIATMNTADRSIRTLDAAVRRRFEFFELRPSPAVLGSFYAERTNEVPDLISGFVALNDALTGLLDRHHTVGHTFFMDGRGMTAARLAQIWDRQVQPLIEDYLFDMPDELAAMTMPRFWPSTLGQ